MLAKLPNEILEHIMFYCKGVDRHTIARCSKHLNTVMEPSIWRAVHITTNLLTKRWNDSLFNKFRHVKKMEISFSDVPRSRTGWYTLPRSKEFKRNLAMILDNIQPSRLIEAVIEIYASTRSASSENFIQIMERLTSIKRLDLIALELTEKAWKSIPGGLVHLGLIGHSPRAFCNITDKALKEILGRSQLDSFECELDLFQKGLSEESLHQISKVESITELKIELYIPPPLSLCWIANLRNLRSLDLRGKIYPLEGQGFVSQICRNLQQLEILTLAGLELGDQSFSEIHLLSNLTKLSIYKMASLFACHIFHSLKHVNTLHELCFDGWTFPELTLCYAEYMTDDRRDEIYGDIAALNQLPNLRKIGVDCRDDFDISEMIVKGLCKEKKWIHQYEGHIHTFINTLALI